MSHIYIKLIKETHFFFFFENWNYGFHGKINRKKINLNEETNDINPFKRKNHFKQNVEIRVVQISLHDERF
jgi:hypothetical protein